MILRIDVEPGYLAEDPLLRHLRPHRIDLKCRGRLGLRLCRTLDHPLGGSEPHHGRHNGRRIPFPVHATPPVRQSCTSFALHSSAEDPHALHVSDVYDLFANRQRCDRVRADRAVIHDPAGSGEHAGRTAQPCQTYKATVKGLTQFGDRRQGTDRNRAAVDWIEAQLKSYGCTTERIKYVYDPPPAAAGGRGRGNTGLAVGGGRPRGDNIPTGVNTDPMKQPDEKLRALNMQPTTPGPREMVFCTKVGTTHPDEITSSAATWTATAGARRRTTMDPAPRW